MSFSASFPVAAQPQLQQLWFFLVEHMESHTYSQAHCTSAELGCMHLTLQTMLDRTQGFGFAREYSFWIYSQSMQSAVEMLHDDAIYGTYKMYCARDPVVHVIMRRATEPCPNSSQAPSHGASLGDRQSIAASRGLRAPDLPTSRAQPQCIRQNESPEVEMLDYRGGDCRL
ncbi:hypothetical protein B0I35DRAFT_485272 [Stachybotrys elegans]|uniref:Uncharacterized protein n=1 Tax=Stachybotrys elegans TaxID=80388 RepID=A0A8K0WJS7_9HYPO|nr:hypothetical protein B0I35DRAFT_485272 [Stachybotrys elegans]